MDFNPKRFARVKTLALGILTACALCAASLDTLQMRQRDKVTLANPTAGPRTPLRGGKSSQQQSRRRSALSRSALFRLRGGWYQDDPPPSNGYPPPGHPQAPPHAGHPPPPHGHPQAPPHPGYRIPGQGPGAPGMGSAPYYPPHPSARAVNLPYVKEKRPLRQGGGPPVELPRKKDKVSSADSYIQVQPGEMLCARYRVIGLKGQGTFGTVLDSIDTKYNRKIALKVIRSERRYLDAAYKEVEILRKLSELDPKRECLCVRLYNAFEMTHKGKRHICIVFERLGRDLHRFIKENRYRGFHMNHVRHFTTQLLNAVTFCHRNNLIHTDIKPENILLERSDYRYERSWGVNDYKVPVSSRIKLIDFGSAIFSHQHHSRVITTRQYRAPEVILNIGWGQPADIWSIGCILAELRTGRLLFDTHEDLEHLALMEKITEDTMPEKIAEKYLRHPSPNRDPGTPTFVQSNKTLNWPGGAASSTSKAHVEKQRSLRAIFSDELFVDLIKKMLRWNPEDRILPKDALNHPFLQQSAPPPPVPLLATAAVERTQVAVPAVSKTAPAVDMHANGNGGHSKRGAPNGEELADYTKRTRLQQHA